MSRNVRAAVAALALAGGVYLAGSVPAEASNMGFKLERSLDLIRRTSDNRPLQNVYWISFPLFNGLADLADSQFSGGNKCIETGGATTPDGVINSDDAICDMWTARSNPATAGTFTFSYINRDTCTPTARNGTISLGQVRFTGVAFPLVPEIGYQALITVAAGATFSPQNRAVIVGSHDPSFAGRQIIASPTCPTGAPNCCGASAPRTDLINLPYHTMYQKADEILCGLEGVDWVDANGNGTPDLCWKENSSPANTTFDAGVDTTTGVFDGRVAMSVAYFDNTEGTNAPVARNVTIALGQLRFTGTPYNLVPGDAYLLTLSKTHTPTTWLSPHY